MLAKEDMKLGRDAQGEPISWHEDELCFGCGQVTNVICLSADDPYQCVHACSRCLRWLAAVLDA